MSAPDNIVIFPGSPPAPPSSKKRSGRTSVRAIAAGLPPTDGRLRDGGRLPALSIDLIDLAGVDDETIGRLSIAAVEGYVTCASAARLALRHARELQSDARLEDCGLAGSIADGGPHDICLHLCLRADTNSLDMAVAPVWSLQRIVESGFPTGPAVAVFTGRDHDGHEAFAVASTAAWMRSVPHLTADPDFAFADRVHLFFWGEASEPRTRRAVSIELARRIAFQGSARRLGRSSASRRQSRVDVRAVASAALLLIAATHPAIFDGSRP